MSKHILLCAAALAVGCGPADEQPNGEEAATASLADFAGTWSVTAMAESSDSVMMTYELHATATTDGWTSTNPGAEPVPVRVVQVEGDSVVVEAGPFESALYEGTMASSRTVLRLEEGMLMGTIRVEYDVDDIPPMTGRLNGTRNTP